MSADESNQVCGCCDTNCGMRTGSDQLLKGMLNLFLETSKGLWLSYLLFVCFADLQEQRASVGPIRVKEYSFGQN